MNPYQNMPSAAFWRSGVVEDINFQDIHIPKWNISKGDCIVTMGSCFAQHVGKKLKRLGYNVPYFDTKEGVRNLNYSANYGNIYTVRQGLQLIQEANSSYSRSEVVWKVEDGFIDPIRPNVFSIPFETENALIENRNTHLKAVRKAIENLDLLVFTLGLTEAWECVECESVLPVVPGVLGGTFNSEKYCFKNYDYEQVVNDIKALIKEIHKVRGGKKFRLLLTVSPVPLTATAEHRHVLVSSVASKSILRVVADYFVKNFEFIDYFPSFEIITCPKNIKVNYEDNLRDITQDAVDEVMRIFQNSYEYSHALAEGNKKEIFHSMIDEVGDVDCEDALLERFSHETNKSGISKDILFFGNSHLGSMRTGLTAKTVNRSLFVPINFLQNSPIKNIKEERFKKFLFSNSRFTNIHTHQCNSLVLVGYGVMGDGLLRAFGPLKRGYEGCVGEAISPLIPLEIINEESIKNLFRKQLNIRALHLNMIVETQLFRDVILIPSPDLPEKIARFRFGDEFVDSMIYLKYKVLYSEVFQELFENLFSRVTFLFHENENLYSDFGFVHDRYAGTLKWDIHPNREFYIDSDIESRLNAALNYFNK